MRPPAPRCFGSTKNPIAETDTADPLSVTQLAKIAKGLGHPARIAILEQFSTGKARMVQDIVDKSDLAPSTVSEHLRLLRDAGLLTARRDGPRMWYCMERAVLRTFAESMATLAEPTDPCRPEDVMEHGTKGPNALRRITKSSPQQIVNAFTI